MNFSRLVIELLDSLLRHRNDSEDNNITIFSNNLLKFAIDFINKIVGQFRVNRSSRANEFFSGRADIILHRFLKQILVLIIGIFKGSNYALGVKASRVLAISIFLFSLFISQFFDDFVCVLICWSGRVLVIFLV